ncbi:MAG: M28 family peptidase [Rhodobacteraceae bacterium]|nr:M28 family peptidase [Paracoccaceae bacterium]
MTATLSEVCAAIDGGALWSHMEVFARHTKEAGSPGERASLAHVEAALKGWGYATRLILHEALISLPQAGARVTCGDWTGAAITHSFGRPAPAGGLAARAVDLGAGGEVDFARADVRGRIVIVNGIANPVVTRRASLAGALGQIHVSAHEHRHEMCLSPVWGSPDDRKIADLPTTVVLTVAAAEGGALRALLAARPEEEVRLFAAVDTGWRATPILLAEMMPAGRPDAPFVFFTGHHDAWYHGVMDNGGANATMLEVARLAAARRDRWARGMRLAFWSGHSQGRYSSSSWYADHHWEDLAARALVHVNVDSTGGTGNTHVADTTAAAELAGLAAEAIAAQAGQVFANGRMGRAGDQSFWGIGVPAIFGNMSTQPPDPADSGGGFFRAGKRGGFGTGWWWHTPADTLDKIDRAILVRDTAIYMHTVWRLLTDPVLPLDYAAHGRYLLAELDALEAAAGAGRFDLGLLRGRARRLVAAAGRFAALAARARDAGEAARLGAALQRVARALVPVDYTDCDPFDHDPALPMGPYPGLQPLRRLAALAPGSDAAHLLETRLVRARTRVAVALAAAVRAFEDVTGPVEETPA